MPEELHSLKCPRNETVGLPEVMLAVLRGSPTLPEILRSAAGFLAGIWPVDDSFHRCIVFFVASVFSDPPARSRP